MDEPSRILAEGGAFESGLLGAWRERQPSDAARLGTLAAVGLGGIVGTAGVSIAPKAIVASSSLLKWLLVGAGVLTTAGAVGYVTITAKTAMPASATASDPPTPPARTFAPRVAAPVAAPVEPHVAPAATTPPREEPASTTEVPVAAHVVAAHAASSNAVVPGTPQTKEAPTVHGTPSSLDDEVLAMDRARRALSSGDAHGAIERVDAYDARFPSGALRQESAEIRIEALFRLGDRPLARKLADRFIATYPTSPYTHVIRTLVDDAAPPAP